ncbi:MAG: DUF2062 domain-containing protein [Ectothiorhodospiraceae bacterium]|nr:DUF2062 domain-containing protein [Chromatiales bacterium]MCP5157557.1 DUF2062 domain-containing protein [Ectothiorhodospiraceae bacterium]
MPYPSSASARGAAPWLRRQLVRRLVVPVTRGWRNPDHAARGVLFGLAVALTPTVGVQMPIVFALWLLVRRVRPAWDFSLVVGLAWTWVTNIFTAPPLYYVYVVTGRLMLGEWDGLHDYERFASTLNESMPRDVGWLQGMWEGLVGVFERFGVPIFVGSLPWVILGTWVGYRWSLRLLRRIAVTRAARRAARGRVPG